MLNINEYRKEQKLPIPEPLRENTFYEKPPQPQMVICPAIGRYTWCGDCAHREKHGRDSIWLGEGDQRHVDLCGGDKGCPICIPYIEPQMMICDHADVCVSKDCPAKSKHECIPPCVNRAGLPCEHIGRDIPHCIPYVEPVNAPSEMVGESKEIEQLKEQATRLLNLAYEANRQKNQLAKLVAVKMAEIERLRAELAPPGNPQRDTRTRTDTLEPPVGVHVLAWWDGTYQRGIAKRYGENSWRMLDKRYPEGGYELYSPTHWAYPNWFPFTPIPEPTYTVAEHGMPKEVGWYWIEYERFHQVQWDSDPVVWTEESQEEWKLSGKNITRYQRIYRPEEKK